MEHHHAMDHIHQLMGIDALDYSGFFTILSYSFFASLHCGFMCAPLVCASLQKYSQSPLNSLINYNVARIISYGMMGALLGFIGQSLTRATQQGGFVLAWIIGIFVCLSAVGMVFPKLKNPFQLRSKLSGALNTPLKHLSRLASNGQSWATFPSLGLLTVLLPCMTLTPALAMAAGSGSPLAGLAFMFAFGLGTLPIMFLVPRYSQSLLRQLPAKAGVYIAAVFLMLAGLITLMRPYH